MIDYVMNKAQADELFDQNAVMMGEYGNNVVFDYKIAEIFSETILTWAERVMHSEHAYIKFSDDWGTWGDCGCDYFYRSGFRKIVSQHNYLVSMEQYKASEGGKLCEMEGWTLVSTQRRESRFLKMCWVRLRQRSRKS